MATTWRTGVEAALGILAAARRQRGVATGLGPLRVILKHLGALGVLGTVRLSAEVDGVLERLRDYVFIPLATPATSATSLRGGQEPST